MPRIMNLSKQAVKDGDWRLFGGDCILISINDPGEEPPVPSLFYKNIKYFFFLDIESDEGDIGEFAITEGQAARILQVLQKAREDGDNVVVHCHAGLCRSGAVVQFAADYLGFEDVGNYKIPNSLVMKRMKRAIGDYYG